ncbi:hypothetical protein N8329_02160 [Crocinitomicaceae bacterium]|jgi:hypothetical protein|nr:hypothetical protein [Crocinitomicaceae bacterium]
MKLVLLLTVSLFYSCVDCNKLELENLIFDNSELPDGCRIKAVGKSDHLPCNAKSNPFISSDSEYLECFVSKFVNDTLLIQKIDRGLFSIYTDGTEIGIFAVKTDSESTAKLIKKDVEMNNENMDKSELFISGTHFIWLWGDEGKNKNLSEIKTLIEKEIE